MKHLLALAYVTLLPALPITQIEKTPWKEIIYATDGFALTVPYPPLPHPDERMPDTTTYLIYLPRKEKVGLTVRVMHQLRDCGFTLGRLKDTLNGKSPDAHASSTPGIDISSIKDISIHGYPGLEYQLKVSPSTTGLERYYCVDGRFYIFSATWPSSGHLPAAATRVMNSFRLVTTDSH